MQWADVSQKIGTRGRVACMKKWDYIQVNAVVHCPETHPRHVLHEINDVRAASAWNDPLADVSCLIEVPMFLSSSSVRGRLDRFASIICACGEHVRCS